LEQATAAQPSERLHRFETICGSRGGCQRQPLTADPGRWTWRAICLTLYDDYAVNPISELTRAH